MKLIPLLLTFVSFLPLFAQVEKDAKRDHTWLMGFDGDVPAPSLGGMAINFNENPTGIYNKDLYLNFRHSNASICDENGELLFYSNGIRIANKNHELMAGGQGLSPGWLSSGHSESGMVIPQYVLILPKPGSDHLYYVVHCLGEHDDWSFLFYTQKILYSVVDMSLEGGLGEVIQKNKIILEDTLDLGKLTATRHGNGRDWWILVSSLDSKNFYKLLLSPAGLEVYDVQSIDWDWGSKSISNGQAAFSPDGTKYARNHLIGGPFEKDVLDVFDFDRCTGQLSNPRLVRYAPTTYAGGLAFSGNSRFIYVPHTNHLFQFDTEADDLLESMDTVAVYDGFCSPCPGEASFNLAQLAPNNRIYINTPNKSDFMHVIYQPDSLGVACNVQQHEFELPTLNDNSLPNFPNFRLGKWEDSPCDTIISSRIESPSLTPSIAVFPSPANETIRVEWANTSIEPVRFILSDMLGKEVRYFELAPGQLKVSFSVADLPAGVYFCMITSKRGHTFLQKLIIAH
jgi:hypothetical protein